MTVAVEFDQAAAEVEFSQVFVIFDEHSTTIFFKMDSTEQTMLSYCGYSTCEKGRCALLVVRETLLDCN